MHLRPLQLWHRILVVSALLLANSAAAEPSIPNAEADTHFRRGVAQYQVSRYDEAIEEFTIAHRISGDYRYLYNLGQAHAARWKPIEAIEVFERYLRDGTGQINAQRRMEVEQALTEQRARIAWLELRVSPQGTRVRVDGRDVGISPIVDPVVAVVGEHVVSAALEGHRPIEQQFNLKGQERKQVALTLEAIPSPPPRTGQIAIDCLMPEVQVYVDERQVATTPVTQHLVVEEGTHTVKLVRAGYQTQATTERVNEAGLAQVKCDLPVAPLSPAAKGTLHIELPEPNRALDTEVRVDGKVSPTQITLPAGAHLVELQCEGYIPWRETIRITAGEIRELSVTLLLTPSHRQALRSRAQTRRNWAQGLGVAGIASLGTALGLAIWNNGRYDDWTNERDRIQAAYDAYDKGQNLPANFESRQSKANDLLDSVHSVDIITAGLAIVGGAMVVGAAILYFGGDSPDRYAEPKSQQLGSPQNNGATVASMRAWHQANLSMAW